MFKKGLGTNLIILVFFFGVMCRTCGTGLAKEQSKDPIKDPGRVTVVISKRIRPYLMVFEGISDNLDSTRYELTPYFLSRSNLDAGESDLVKLNEQLAEKPFDLLVAVGPEAASFAWSKDFSSDTARMYTAVLNPASTIGEKRFACGISLRIPVDIQVEKISKALPGIKNIGLIFDERFNLEFYEQAHKAAVILGKAIVPMAVDSRKQIPGIMKKNWNRMDCIWIIPDRTVVSEKIVQYIIKQALFQKKGVIGYNSFFIRSGAVYSFEFNYQDLGKQTAEKINSFFLKGECLPEPPVFNEVYNEKLSQKIGLWKVK